MRAQFDLRLTLTEQETTDIAVAAFHAKLPMIEWIRKQLTVASASALASSPSEAPQAAINTAIAPQTVAPQAPPAPAMVPTIQATASAPLSGESWRETNPAQPPVQQSTIVPPSPRIEPTRSVAPGNAPAPRTEPRIVPATPAAAPPVARERRPRTSSADRPNIPRGFYAILEIAEKIDAARRRIAAEVGTSRGINYVTRMGEWYRQEGIKDFDQSTRNYLVDIGQKSAQIRQWFRSQRPGSVSADVMPHQLLRSFKNWVERNGPVVPEEPEPKPEPESDTEVVPVASPFRSDDKPSDETLIFSPGKGIQRRSLHEFLAEAGPSNGPTTIAPPEIITAAPVRWDNFTKVTFSELNPYDARVLRRFAAQLVNHGGARESLVDEKIATMIRNIRGQESGDNPPCVEALRRMGVILGMSGTFRLRPEFIERFREVRIWAEV